MRAPAREMAASADKTIIRWLQGWDGGDCTYTKTAIISERLVVEIVTMGIMTSHDVGNIAS